MGKWVRTFGDNFAKTLRTFCEQFTEIGIFSCGNGAGNVAIIFSECDFILLIAALWCARNLFFAHLASWSSPFTHQDQLVVFRQLLGVFDVTRFICRLRPRRWPFVSIFIAISGVSHFIRISLRIHRRRARLAGGIRIKLTSCIRTHHLRHSPVTLEIDQGDMFYLGSAK